MGMPWLEFARDNKQFALRQALAEIAQKTPEPDAYFSAGVAYRVLGICALLEEADPAKFAMNLAKAGQTRLTFLQRVARGLQSPPLLLCTSKDVFFTASLAAGDLDTARAIAQLASQKYQEGEEYEDDFLFVHFLHRLLVDPKNVGALEGIVQRWEEVLDGQTSAYQEVCCALLPGAMPDGFDGAFTAFIEERQSELRAYARSGPRDEELYATEGKIFIEGLAVLRLAELQQFPSQPQYPLVPRLARIPLGEPLPPPGAWARI